MTATRHDGMTATSHVGSHWRRVAAPVAVIVTGVLLVFLAPVLTRTAMQDGSGTVRLDPGQMANLVIIVGVVTLAIFLFVFCLSYLLLSALDRAARAKRP